MVMVVCNSVDVPTMAVWLIWYSMPALVSHWEQPLRHGKRRPRYESCSYNNEAEEFIRFKAAPRKNKPNKTFSICPMHSCATIGFCEPQGLIGSGKTHIRTCVSIAQAQSKDAQESGVEVPTAISAFASLGSSGRHCSSEERDMHRWLGQLHGIQLQTYPVSMKLEVQNLVWPKIVTNLNAL